MTSGVEDFKRYRPLLFSIAHRMLGSVAEAEDLVPEAYLRWREVPEGAPAPRGSAGKRYRWQRTLLPSCLGWRKSCCRGREVPPL
jgi:hypothetical protein